MSKKNESLKPQTNTMLLWAPPGSPTLLTEQLVVHLSEHLGATAADGQKVELTDEQIARAVKVVKSKPGKVVGLLLKLRKGAYTGFGTSDWMLVFAVLGFGFEVVKEEREIVGAWLTLPNGEKLHVEKEPNYRHIVYYGLEDGSFRGDMVQWCASKGFLVKDLASKAMGVRTVEEDDKLREYKARDWTNTGTCGICNNNVKRAADGGLVLHGYQRPGDGYAHGQCFGKGYQPYELSPKACQDFIPVLERELKGHKHYLTCLQAGEVEKLLKRAPSSLNAYVAQYVVKGEPDFPRYLESEVHTVEGRIRETESYITYFQKKVDGWKLDELPEVKVAKFLASAEE